MKIKFLTLILSSLVLSMTACFERTETLKPKISGKAGEVMVVIPEYKWESGIGNALIDVLAQDQVGLPQSEPLFDMIHVVPDQFSKIFTSHRNIMLFKVGPEFSEEKITVQRDQWATPQLVINFQATSDSNIVQLIRNNAEYLIDRINLAERERVIINYKRYQETEIVEEIRKKYDLSLFIPKGYSLDLDSTHFAWLESETPRTLQGLFIYDYPYTDEHTFTPEYLTYKRNQMLKKYVPGPVMGSWMTTEELLPPEFDEFELEERYFAELRGLWKLENGFMGGPFVSLSTVDERRNRVVTVEGWVYAPDDEKRELLRQVESILYTLRLNTEE
jgi:hypothetical protein